MVCWFCLKDDGSDGGKHKDKVIASQLVNLKLFATIVPSQSQIEVQLQPATSKVVFATLHLTLSCVFLRQGKATYVGDLLLFRLRRMHERQTVATGALCQSVMSRGSTWLHCAKMAELISILLGVNTLGAQGILC